MEAGEIRLVHFPILPMFEIDECEVTVSAYTALDMDTDTLPITIDVCHC